MYELLVDQVEMAVYHCHKYGQTKKLVRDEKTIFVSPMLFLIKNPIVYTFLGCDGGDAGM